MKRTLKLLGALALAAAAIIPGFGVALADDGHDVGVLRPNLGPTTEGQIPGVNGYKVFGPKAIAMQGTMGIPDGILVDTRTGITDAMIQPGVQALGSHTSLSPYDEDTIRVDGGIKESGDLTWENFNSRQTSGTYAWVGTNMPDPAGSQTFVAHSWHNFFDVIFGTWSAETEDTVNG